MDLSSTLNAISGFVNHLPTYAHLIAPWIGGGALASVVLQWLKHKLSLESPRVLVFMLGVLSFSEAAIQYITNQAAQNPAVLGKNTAALVGLATAIYRLPMFGVKDVHQLISDAQTQRKLNAPAPAVPTTTATEPAPEQSTENPAPSEPAVPSVFEG
jgi:hypothetical protein